MNGRNAIQWSPRVSKSKLRKLYQSDAAGRLDEELLTEVGMILLLRCQDILTIYQAKQGKVKCPSCVLQGRNTVIARIPHKKGDPRDERILCRMCGWEITWGDYYLSIKRKQLNPGGAVSVFEAYVKDYKAAHTPQKKVLAVDRLIHEFHTSLIHDSVRPVGVNLIQGKLTDVVTFLDQLTYGDNLPKQVQVNREIWRGEMQRTHWADLVDSNQK